MPWIRQRLVRLSGLTHDAHPSGSSIRRGCARQTAISGCNYLQDASLCLPHTWTPTVHRVRLLRRHLGEPAINYLLEDSWLDSKRIRAFLQTPASDSVLPLHDENFDIDNPIRADMKRLFLLYHYENHCARFDSMGDSHRTACLVRLQDCYSTRSLMQLHDNPNGCTDLEYSQTRICFFMT
eukprot:COSAG01_NODE_8258_length_2854_cov_8.360436_4_plen_181_part_00